MTSTCRIPYTVGGLCDMATGSPIPRPQVTPPNSFALEMASGSTSHLRERRRRPRFAFSRLTHPDHCPLMPWCSALSEMSCFSPMPYDPIESSVKCLPVATSFCSTDTSRWLLTGSSTRRQSSCSKTGLTVSVSARVFSLCDPTVTLTYGSLVPNTLCCRSWASCTVTHTTPLNAVRGRRFLHTSEHISAAGSLLPCSVALSVATGTLGTASIGAPGSTTPPTSTLAPARGRPGHTKLPSRTSSIVMSAFPPTNSLPGECCESIVLRDLWRGL
mmetsp:Transcript_21018/g.50775  ORF Transcript_21018/g.50775 Transcript_21018/m.50775 type:complete len:273 (-) Transcript_21018:1329-2147(-)